MTPFSKQISNLDDFYNTPKEWRKIPVVVACATIGHVGGHVTATTTYMPIVVKIRISSRYYILVYTTYII